ncbi:DUF4954 family protein [Saccharicrinis sp. GN24d3]|uniref:DUF4954 family protein n=1 Tax=Saccharicrinis sp. GN24d3 TaxID=3458416 RepID=UPI0040370196
MSYRNLTKDETKALESQNCIAIDGWDKVQVTTDFVCTNIKNVTFSGKNYLGAFYDKIPLPSKTYDFSGIYNARLHNCTIKNRCYIKNIGTAISNYIIQEDCIIQHVGTLMAEGESSFGNGTEVNPVNEAGGREVIIYDELSAHTAYLMAFYRHKPKLIENLEKTILSKVQSITSKTGYIGKNTAILNCGMLKNIKTGSDAILEGVPYLSNGSINSTSDAPTYIGTGVNAADFIVSSGSTVSDNAYLRHCFVGQGCEIANSYTAENSLFFANSQCLQGEACSIFAGPFTVTHHKSTLLIAGYYSFFNAGSGTNQSNHMYKLGPVHQGIIERGGKTGSDSYVMWPAQIGAFTMILGRHYSNPDISSLPFSYLIENDGKSILMPAQNIFNVGVTRDAQKWPKRDKRKGKNPLDYVISEALNPHTINKILDGIEILKQLQQKASPQGKNLMYKNTQLSLISIIRGIKLYEQALVKYVGDELIYAIKRANFDSIKKSFVYPENNQWVDLAGLLCKTSILDVFIEEMETNKPNTGDWNTFYNKQFNAYNKLKQAHAFNVLKQYFNIDIVSCTNEEISNFVKNWMDNNTKVKNSILMDAKKEFNTKSKIGFGIDGDIECRDIDFSLVRGKVEDNSFVKGLELEYDNINKEAELLINQLTK